ncbi:MAG: malate synthase A [Myxococcales bacterium]|nr:malate synthase A [Myxococcales bacterium]HQY64586.1 malate synthase A [Polyangiaceae bacterium]
MTSSSEASASVPGVVVRAGAGSPSLAEQHVLTPAALAFVADLARTFGPRIREILAARVARRARMEAGATFDFLPESAGIRAADWTVAPLPPDLLDRRVEITGPVDRKMVVNALNSGARVFMADFEDATCPTWENQIEGQQNLFDAVRRTISLETKGKTYRLNAQIATLLVRPRGFHLDEKHVTVDGLTCPGSVFDFGLYFFHNARELLARGTGPYFYLPKLEGHLEARVWNDVFVHAQRALGLPVGTIKATVLIETLPAAFEMDEILYELRDHSAGLNCGRWDYIFSFIKKRAQDPAALVPDRAQLTMDKGFLRAYSELLIRTCHRRNVHAMGGMAAQIPIKGDDAANEAAFAKVRADKVREATNGHDGTWVAHPALVPVALEVFDAHMPGRNQLDKKREDVAVSADDLLAIPPGTRTEAGLRHNVRVGVQYIEAWLRGQGCVPLYNLMEDAATAEISRAQVWQEIRHEAKLDDGTVVTRARLATILDEELARVATEVGAERFGSGKFAEARALFEKLSTEPSFEEFLTLSAYDHVLAHGG